METIIKYTPSNEDVKNMNEIRDFFNEEGIPYEESKEIYGLFYLNNKSIQLRYVNSYVHPIDNSDRFSIWNQDYSDGEINGKKGESWYHGKKNFAKIQSLREQGILIPTCKGVGVNYFIDISHENAKNDIRTIWIFDFEMAQKSIIYKEGKEIKDYRRQWEVIKNTLRTATGHIHHRFYARDTEVKEIDNATLRAFLETNCFYGYRSSNKNLGLFLKKDKDNHKKGDLLMILTFGYNFYGNKKHPDDPYIEIIRASTLIGCQVIGGMSKLLKYFCDNYPILKVNGKDIKVDILKFYVDASHNDGRGMAKSALQFRFDDWSGAGFMNRWCCDYNDGSGLKGKKGEIFQRKPAYHKKIMQLIGEGKIVSIANAGTIVCSIHRQEYLDRFGK